MTVPLPRLLADRAPVFAAPMAGGASTPELVIAAATAGHFGQLAAGYLTPEALRTQIDAVRERTAVFGVNLFVPHASRASVREHDRYRAALRPTAERLGVLELPDLHEDDDRWEEKVQLLLSDPVPLVSFTFGLPSPDLIRSLRARGSLTVQTITSAAEARAAEDLGVDVLVVQAAGAGGHSGVIDPRGAPSALSLPDLVEQVRRSSGLPVIGAGGMASPDAVPPALRAGAAAVAVGTVLLRSPESGASRVHKDALIDPVFDRTALTRAFTGRLARALVNRFVEDHDSDAPAAYPAVHHLTRPIRSAAAALGDASAMHLWAGTGWRLADDRPAGEVLASLAREV
ncbi:NAD(P)H-dependent flavin oxidoreductase [Clavibacter michiganensis]|uniref:NAD(P)H-dependent flavin oxidoreductase n=1 Tax=Clavibacter michiganensis TaxID=28447 RepID=UPI003EB7F52E